MDFSAVLEDRAILAISGPDSRHFLQGLITNDVHDLAPGVAIYAALLTPQGKILFDFLLYQHASTILVDCAGAIAEGLQKRFSLYRLRAKVDITERTDMAVVAYWGQEPPASPACLDPRVSALGWRRVVTKENLGAGSSASDAYTAHRLDLGVPEGADFGQDRMFALDADLDELHGVAFDKGCYIGQELTARMKHRGTARKKLLPIDADGLPLPSPGISITAEGRELGALTSTYGTRGFALLRLDRLENAAGATLAAGDVPIRVGRPPWLLP